MKAYQITQSWGYKNLELKNIEEPVAKPGHVIIKVHSISLNFRDHLVIMGHYNPRYPLPLVPCSDSAGVIVSVGQSVNKFREGDRVMNHCAQTWMFGSMDRDTLKNTMGGPLPGTLQEYIQLPQDAVLEMPDHLDFNQACTLPCAAVTAYSAMFTHGNLQPNEYVLVLGTGGVSIFALQLAKLQGAKVIVTSSSEEKLKFAKELGADEIINYKTNPDWEKKVLEMTQGKGVDHVIEVGGAGTFEKSLKAVRPGGKIYLIGVLAGVSKDLNLLPVLMFNIQVQGIFVGNKDSFLNMNKLISKHKMIPVVDKVFEFEEAKDALHHLSTGRHIGKVVVQIT